MSLRRLMLALCLLTLSACVTYPDISQSRSPCRMEPGGWCGFLREGAVDVWPYAVASANAYTGDDDVFTHLGPVLEKLERLPITDEAADKGFGYEIFAQYASGTYGQRDRQPIARILAFRGTDFDGFTDIFYGTLRNDQIELAQAAFEAERARPEFADGVEWVVAGHSLGGALATEVSIAHPHVRAFMFNTSPFYGGEDRVNDMQRTVFNERGEVLRKLARYDLAPAADVYTLNCAPRNGQFTKHKIRPLADCITWIAAYGDPDALKTVLANGVHKPMVECGDEEKPHPGVMPAVSEPCLHRGRPEKDDAR